MQMEHSGYLYVANSENEHEIRAKRLQSVAFIYQHWQVPAVVEAAGTFVLLLIVDAGVAANLKREPSNVRYLAAIVVFNLS